MRTFKHYCREHRLTRKRVIWLGLLIFGDDLVVIVFLAATHYLHLGSGVGIG